MSVLMGCGKKMMKQKSSSKIQSNKPVQRSQSNEQTSDSKKSVWSFDLEKKKITLIMNKETRQIVCDGRPIQTFEGHFEGDNEGGGNNDDFHFILDFTIFISKEHRGRLLKQHESGNYQLYLDGNFVPENLPSLSSSSSSSSSTRQQESEFLGNRQKLGDQKIKRSFSLDAGNN